MALDDFAPEEEELEPAAPGPAEGLAADEDLLDLDVLRDVEELLQDGAGEQGLPDLDAFAPLAQDPAAVEAAELVGDAGPGAPASAGETLEIGRAEAPVDPDEDIFDFGAPSAVHVDNLAEIGTDLDTVLDRIGAQAEPQELLAFDLAADELPPRRAEPAPAPAALPHASPELARPVPVVVQPASARPTWIGIASVLAANFTLLFFAWSASRSLHANLDAVRHELGAPARLVRAEPAPDPQAPPEAAAPEPTHPAVPPPPLEAQEEIALKVAEQEISERRFGDARLRLYRLLAVLDGLDGLDGPDGPDGLSAETRADVEARALLLVGDAYATAAAEEEIDP